MSDDQPETGDSPAEAGIEVSVEFPKRRISLTSGEQNVEVEGPDDLDALSRTASALWTLTTSPQPARFGFSAGSSLITEIHPGEYGTDTTGEPDDRHRQAA